MRNSFFTTILVSVFTVLTVVAFMGTANVHPTNAPTPPGVNSAEPFIGEVIMFAGNFAPRGWAFCEGQLLPISQNQALFSILGTTYGGDGRTTFGLPDLRGRAPIGAGTGPGLSNVRQGTKGGAEQSYIYQSNLPSLEIQVPAVEARGNSKSPANAVMAAGESYYTGNAKAWVNMKSLQLPGSNQPLNNMQPYLGLRFIIALQGVYPSRN